jgi:hypothetical protein
LAHMTAEEWDLEVDETKEIVNTMMIAHLIK